MAGSRSGPGDHICRRLAMLLGCDYARTRRLAGTGAGNRRRGAGVAELADALDLGSSDENRGGSNPPARTNANIECNYKGLRETRFSYLERSFGAICQGNRSKVCNSGCPLDQIGAGESIRPITSNSYAHRMWRARSAPALLGIVSWSAAALVSAKSQVEPMWRLLSDKSLFQRQSSLSSASRSRITMRRLPNSSKPARCHVRRSLFTFSRAAPTISLSSCCETRSRNGGPA